MNRLNNLHTLLELNEKDFTELGFYRMRAERGYGDCTEKETLYRCEVLTDLIVRQNLVAYKKDVAEFLSPSVRVLYLYELYRLNGLRARQRFSRARCDTLRFRINELLETSTRLWNTYNQQEKKKLACKV